LLAVDNHLADTAVDLLHGVNVHTVARHLRRLLVLGQNGLEALRITFGLRHDAILVGLRLFLQTRSRAGGARNHIVGISLGLIFGTLTLLTGFEHIVKRGLNLLRWAYTALLQVDTNDFNAQL